jgi:Effector-associated domain 2
MQWAFKLPGEELPVGQPRGHEQFVFMAAKDGQVAKNLGKEKTGLFSQNLLQELSRDPGSVWPPDMKKLVEAVQARFEALRAAGQAHQTPIYLSSQDWDGSSMSLRVGSVRAIDQLHPKTPWKLTTKQKRTLADALLACHTIQNSDARDTAVGELRAEIRNAVRRSSSAQTYVWNLISAASDYAGGIEELLEIVHMFEGDSLDWQNLQMEATKALPNSGLSQDRTGGI